MITAILPWLQIYTYCAFASHPLYFYCICIYIYIYIYVYIYIYIYIYTYIYIYIYIYIYEHIKCFIYMYMGLRECMSDSSGNSGCTVYLSTSTSHKGGAYLLNMHSPQPSYVSQ